MATDAEFKYHRSYMGTRQIAEARQRLADAGHKKISPEDYLNPKIHYNCVPSGSLGQAASHDWVMWEKPDQDFDTYATDWENDWSTLTGWGSRGKFIPVVSQDMTVIGHYGSVGGGVRTDLIVRRDHVPSDAVLRNGRMDQRTYLSIETFYTDDVNAFLALGVEAYVHHRDKTPPPGYVFCDMLTTQHEVWVETLMDGQVSRVVDIRNTGHLVPLPSAILDVLLAARSLVKFQLHGSRVMEALQIKATNYRQARAQLAGPTAKAADDAMTVRRRVADHMSVSRGKIWGKIRETEKNHWFHRDLPKGGRLHMSRGQVDQYGLGDILEETRRPGKKQVVLSGTHGTPLGDPSPSSKGRGGRLDWKESPPNPNPNKYQPDGRDFLRNDIKDPSIGNNGHSAIKVRDITRMSQKELNTLLSSGEDIYAGFCESACTLAIRRAFEAVTQ